MSEIRIDPFTNEYILVNNKRLERPVQIINNLQKNQKECPFCPESKTRQPGLPKHYEALSIKNLYPALTIPADPFNKISGVFENFSAEGVCEVILYSSNHDMEFYDQPLELTNKIIQLWISRYKKLELISQIKYIFIFENRGEAVGVTISHPHCQLYALPFIPPRIEIMLKNIEKAGKNESCLTCDIISLEIDENKRIIKETVYFIAFIPYFAKMLYEIQIIPKRHIESIKQFSQAEIVDFAKILMFIRRNYDLLFNKKANYMMFLYNPPINIDVKGNWHFRTEIMCLERDGVNIKYRAGVESGLLVWSNDLSPEEAAKHMKELNQ